MKTHYTRKEVQELLGISNRTITRKVKNKELKFIIKNNKQLFPKDQFENIPEGEKTTYDSFIDILQEQLREKDSQIKALQEQLREKDNKHHLELTQQQVLTKQLQDRFLMLEQPKPIQKKKPKKRTVSTNKKKDNKGKKTGFLSRLFE